MKSAKATEELKTLRRIEELLEIMARSQTADALRQIHADKKARLLYELTGKVTREELITRTGFSAGKISALWQEWEALGIVKKDGKRFRKVLP